MAELRETARGIVYENGKLLVIERWRTLHDGTVFHYYSIPGGGIEPGESPEQTVNRELNEELGIEVEIDRLLATQTVHEANRRHYYFLCSRTAGEPHLSADSPEAQRQTENNRYRVAWISLTPEAIELFHPEYRELILQIRDKPVNESPLGGV